MPSQPTSYVVLVPGWHQECASVTTPGLLQAPRWMWLSELRAHVLRGSVPGLRTGPGPQQVLRKCVHCMAQGLLQAKDRSTSREMLGICSRAWQPHSSHL